MTTFYYPVPTEKYEQLAMIVYDDVGPLRRMLDAGWQVLSVTQHHHLGASMVVLHRSTIVTAGPP